MAALASCAVFSGGSVCAADYSYVPTLGEDSGYTVKEVDVPTETSITTYEVIAPGQTKAHYYELIVKDGADVGAAVAPDEPKLTIQKDYINIKDADSALDYSENWKPKELVLKGDFINNELNGPLVNPASQGAVTLEGNIINNKSTGECEISLTSPILNSFKGNVYNNEGVSGLFGAAGSISDSNFINNKNNNNLYDDIEAIDNPLSDEFIGLMYPMGGGAITSIYLGNIKNSYFEGNSTVYNGGAILNNSNLINYGGKLWISLFCPDTLVSVVNLVVVDDDGNILGKGYAIKANVTGTSVYAPSSELIGKDMEAPNELIMLALYSVISDMFSDEIIEETVNISDIKTFDGTQLTKADLQDFLASEPINFNELFESMGMYKNSTIINSSFVNNHAGGADGFTAKGGAIYSANDLSIRANSGKGVVFKGNYTINNGVRDDNAIYMDRKLDDVAVENLDLGTMKWSFMPSTLNLDATDGGRIFFYDKISGSNRGQHFETDDKLQNLTMTGETDEHYNINISGDKTGSVYLLNDVENAPNITLSDTNLYLGRDNVINNSALTLNSGTLNLVNAKAGISALNNLTVTGDTNFVADVDLKNKEMDRFTASSYGSHTGNLNVVGMNLLSDAKEDKTEIYFAQTGLKDSVTTSVKELNALTPIYKYSVNYDKREDGGYFVFNRGSNGGTNPQNPSNNFNPAVLAGPVAAQSGALSVATQTFNYAFQNADNFMNIPYMERIAIKNANKYALRETEDFLNGGNFSPLFTKNETSSVWVKPYASFESVPLKNGPKVSNITYGTLVGYDTALVPMKHGWDRVWTGYLGYNGASQRYSGVDSTQNGGLLGGTLTLYKGNFFNATTLSAGASVGSNQTMYGHEDMTMLLAGIGNKTGYNFEFKEGKVILQPNLMMSYTFVNTFDYTNAAGVRIKSDPLHSIQLAPGVKLIGNLKGGWQPYASVNMVWNLLDKSDVHANDVKLPEMSIKPYIQYGVGVQKRFKDKYMAFCQAMIQNGGRNGIALTAGFRWNLGKEGRPIEKVMTPAEQKLSQTSSLRGADATRQSITNKQISTKALNDTGLNAIPAPCGMGSKVEGVNISQTPTKLNLLSQADILARANHTLTTATDKKILKQLNANQKIVLKGKNNTTLTNVQAIVKQL